MIPIPESLKSRKAWLSLILWPLLVVVNRKLHLGLEPVDLALICAGVCSWVIGHANVDASKAADVSGLAQDVAEKAIAILMIPKKPADGAGPAPEVK